MLYEAGEQQTIRRIAGGLGNVYAIQAKGCTLLVDTGPGRAQGQLETALVGQAVVPNYLLLTHTHFDHAGNAAWLKTTFGTEVLVHAAGANNLENGKSVVPQGISGPVGFATKYVFRPLVHITDFQPCQADILISEQYDLAQVGFDAYILPTPGHSADSISLIVGKKIALVGDTLFGMVPGRILPPFADDVPQLIHSWEALLETDCQLFLPGHGGQITRELLESETARLKTTLAAQ